MWLPASYGNGFALRDGAPLYPDLWKNCVGAWAPLLGPSGSTLRENSGFGNHGTLTAELATDWVPSPGKGGGYALEFVTDDYVTIPNATVYSVAANRTWSCWYKGTSDTEQVLIAYADTSANQPYFAIQIGPATGLLTNELITILNEPTGVSADLRLGYCTATRTELFDGNWHHIAVTADGVSYKIYLDGSSKTLTLGRGTNNGTPSISSWNITTIGASRRLSPYGHLNGQFDAAAIHGVALSEANIRLLSLRRGIAYELVPRRKKYFFDSGTSNRRRRLLLTGTH